MGSAAPPPGKMDEKLKSESMQKSTFLNQGGERRYADHTFIQVNFRMHHFVVRFFLNFLQLRWQRGIDPEPKSFISDITDVAHSFQVSALKTTPERDSV